MATMVKLMILRSIILLTLLACASGFYTQPEVVTFTESPESVVVQEGGRAKLRCGVAKQDMYTATNLPHPEVQWLINGTVISESALSGTVEVNNGTSTSTHIILRLVIPSSSTAHEGWYQCRATDGHDASRCSSPSHQCVRTDVLSNRAWVQVIGNTTESGPVVVPVWSSVLLECGSQLVSAGWNGTRVAWNRNGAEFESGMNEFLLSSGDLLVYVDGVGSNATYDCLVNLPDTGVVHYREYWINVSLEISSFLSVHTSSPVALIGGRVELTCSSWSSAHTSPSNASWVLRGAGQGEGGTPVGGSATRLRGHVLVLEAVSLEDAGVYCCQTGGLSEGCIQISVTGEAVSLSAPTDVFIDFRNSSTSHVLDITCPLHLPSLSVTWFRNGIELGNSSERNLMRASSDALVLYGVYQCVIWSGGVHQRPPGGMRNSLHTVARVMPYGISNPPGNIIVDVQPWPNSSSVVIPAYILWMAPNYTGNLPSLGYRISYYSMDFFSDSTRWLTYLASADYRLRLSVYDDELGSASDSTTREFQVDTTCQFQVLFPPILTLSCNRGAPQISLRPNTSADMVYVLFSDILDAPRVNYLEGGCANITLPDSQQTLYESFRNVSYGNHVTFGAGMTFEVGTWCIVRAANTISHSVQDPNKMKCYDPERLYYGEDRDYVQCIVKASVSFVAATYMVNEGAGSVEVCVQAEGYGFIVDLTIDNITTIAESDYNYTGHYQLPFTSAVMSNEVCVNITIKDDIILEPPEDIRLTLSSTHGSVQFQTAISDVTIIDNDYVEVGFQSELINWSESQGNLTACMEMEGELEKNVTVTLNSNGETGFPLGRTVFSFSPGNNHTQCFDVVITDDNVLEEDEELTFSLSSNDEGVRLTSDVFIIRILDDDDVIVRFEESWYNVSEGDGSLQVCVELTGELGKDIAAGLSTENGTTSGFARVVSLQSELTFSPGGESRKCSVVALLDNDVLEDEDTVKLLLTGREEGVLTANASIQIQDDDNVTVQFVNASTLSPVTVYTVLESEGTLDVCVAIIGSSRKEVALTITAQNQTAEGGKDFIGGTESFQVGPFSSSVTRCYIITLLDDSLPGPAKSAFKHFRLHLSSITSGVILPAEYLTVYVVDDDFALRPPVRLNVTAAIAGVLLAAFLVITIVIVTLVILLLRMRKNREKLILTDQVHNEPVRPSDNDPLVKIAFDLTPHHDDFDKMETSSFIFPLNPSYVPWGEERKLSTEVETESMKKFSSSSMLLDAPQVHYKMRKPDHVRKKEDHGDTSGYLNFGDTHNGSEGISVLNQYRSSILSAEELALESLISNPSFREKNCSPESHVLSISSGDEAEDVNVEEQDSSLHPTSPGEELVEASNPAFELNPENTPEDDSEDSRYSISGMNAGLSPPAPPPSTENKHQDQEDSGFPTSDSGCPLSEDCSSPSSFLAEHEEAAAANSALTLIPTEDSGFPLKYSSSPLLLGKTHSAKTMTSETAEDSGLPLVEGLTAS